MMTGWEIPDLTDCLIRESKGEIAGLEKFLEEYPLAALSTDKKYLVIIRDFSFHITDGKINMTNAKGNGVQSHKGITLVYASDDGSGNSWNAVLPDSLEYREIHLTGNEIQIWFGNEKKITNFQEIRKLWSLYKLTENEILERFHSLENKFVEKVRIERQTVDAIETELFGIVNRDDRLDCYRGIFVYEGMNVEILLPNVYKELFDRNLEHTKETLKKIADIQSSMVTQLLPLKNETWLEGGKELDRTSFLRRVKLYAVSVFEDGSSQLYFKAGDLFWGHEIVTTVDTNGNHVDSTIAG